MSPVALYHSPFTRSHLIRFVLEELELPHELRRVDVPAGEHKSPAYLRLNPLGQLPTLLDGDVLLREAAAIALHLGDKAPRSRLVPAPGTPERGPYYQWVVFSVASELAALTKIVLHTRVLPEPLRLAAVAEQGQREWVEVAGAITLGLGNKPYLLGDGFALADVMVGGALWLASFLDVLAPHPQLVAYYERVRERPAFARAYADARAA